MPPAITVGEWLSLVEHLVRDQGVGGSNPLSPTISFQIHLLTGKKVRFSSGGRVHSLFLVALAVDTLGHSNISRDPGVLQQSQDLLPSRSMAGMHGAEAQKMPLSWIEQCADLGESCLPTFAAGKVISGCVRTTSATDLPRSSSTGVAR
jgi:hypothetical protein